MPSRWGQATSPDRASSRPMGQSTLEMCKKVVKTSDVERLRDAIDRLVDGGESANADTANTADPAVTDTPATATSNGDDILRVLRELGEIPMSLEVLERTKVGRAMKRLKTHACEEVAALSVAMLKGWRGVARSGLEHREKTDTRFFPKGRRKKVTQSRISSSSGRSSCGSGGSGSSGSSGGSEAPAGAGAAATKEKKAKKKAKKARKKKRQDEDREGGGSGGGCGDAEGRKEVGSAKRARRDRDACDGKGGRGRGPADEQAAIKKLQRQINSLAKNFPGASVPSVR